MTFCPSCGFNLTADRIIARDGFMLDPRGVAAYHGADIPITPGEALLLHTLAAEQGRAVKAATLGQRISDSDDPENVAGVFVFRIRRKLRDAALPIPIRNIMRRGYAWGLQ